MSDAKVGDRVTPENVAVLPVGTVVEWESAHYGRVSTTKRRADTWVASRNGMDVTFRDADMCFGTPTSIVSLGADPIAAALAIYDAGGSRDEMAAALRGGG